MTTHVKNNELFKSSYDVFHVLILWQLTRQILIAMLWEKQMIYFCWYQYHMAVAKVFATFIYPINFNVLIIHIHYTYIYIICTQHRYFFFCIFFYKKCFCNFFFYILFLLWFWWIFLHTFQMILSQKILKWKICRKNFRQFFLAQRIFFHLPRIFWNIFWSSHRLVFPG